MIAGVYETFMRTAGFMAPRQHPFGTQLHCQHVAGERRLTALRVNPIRHDLVAHRIALASSRIYIRNMALHQ
jgi:hypothetical protein